MKALEQPTAGQHIDAVVARLLDPMTCACTASERELQRLGYMLRHAKRCPLR